MKNVFKMLLSAVVSLVSWPIIKLIDILVVALMLVNKGVREAHQYVDGMINHDDTAKHSAGVRNNEKVNVGYKAYVDGMYPTKGV